MSSYSRINGIALAATCHLLTSIGAGAAPSAMSATQEPIWTHESTGENWIGRVVSLGNEGTQVFSALGIMNGRTRLFSAHDVHPPTPVWEDGQPSFAYNHAVASARRADVHGYLHYEAHDNQSPNQPVLQRYSSASSDPEWAWSFPFLVYHPQGGVCVSDGGDVLVGWVYDIQSGHTAVASFTGGSDVPTAYTTLSLFGQPKAARASSTSDVLYLASTIKTVVMNPLTGQIIHEHVNWQGVGNGHALAGDGSVFAQVVHPNKVHVYERQGDDYQQIFVHHVPGPTLCNEIALSADGSLLVCAFDHFNNWLDVRIQALALDQPGWPVVLDDTTTGAGSFSNVASALSVAADGSAFVVGLWGDELGESPEVRVYTSSDEGLALAYTYDMPGSVNAVSMSADGLRFAVASKAIHANELGTGGRIDLFATHDPDLLLLGVPRSGADVTLRHRTTPDRPAQILRSSSLSPSPTPFPNAGTLYLSLEGLTMLPVGTADENGILETHVTVPDDPTLIGTSLYFQGMSLAPRYFSEAWVKLTILP